MNKMCKTCGESKPLEAFRQLSEQQTAKKRSDKCIHCQTHRYCTYCGKEKLNEDFDDSAGKPATVCIECDIWQFEHLVREDVRIDAEYNGF